MFLSTSLRRGETPSLSYMLAAIEKDCKPEIATTFFLYCENRRREKSYQTVKQGSADQI